MSDTSKVWFITGSSRGCGAELVRALIEGHEDRARVFGLDVTEPRPPSRQSNSPSPSLVASTWS
jgi:NAD(P)-dependent dehydrogenase (short-subunit alcohol dehydrogenase family)